MKVLKVIKKLNIIYLTLKKIFNNAREGLYISLLPGPKFEITPLVKLLILNNTFSLKFLATCLNKFYDFNNIILKLLKERKKLRHENWKITDINTNLLKEVNQLK